jgi:hypothetical protein
MIAQLASVTRGEVTQRPPGNNLYSTLNTSTALPTLKNCTTFQRIPDPIVVSLNETKIRTCTGLHHFELECTIRSLSKPYNTDNQVDGNVVAFSALNNRGLFKGTSPYIRQIIHIKLHMPQITLASSERY